MVRGDRRQVNKFDGGNFVSKTVKVNIIHLMSAPEGNS